MNVVPLSAAALAERLAEAAVSLSLAAAAADPPYGVRVGVDGAVQGDSEPLADDVAGAVAAAGRPVARVRRADFLRPRSVRLELGADDPDAGWERWYDDAALRREVLDSLAPAAARPASPPVRPPAWLPALWDEERDRSVRADRVLAAPGQVVVVDGPYLLRRELADGFDVVVHLETSDAALARRVATAELDRVTASWRRYVGETAPAERASCVVRLEDPRHPALVEN
ncbi:MAG: hypothetical protein ACJ71T_08305 [Actinomycetales bacterium]